MASACLPLVARGGFKVLSLTQNVQSHRINLIHHAILLNVVHSAEKLWCSNYLAISAFKLSSFVVDSWLGEGDEIFGRVRDIRPSATTRYSIRMIANYSPAKKFLTIFATRVLGTSFRVPKLLHQTWERRSAALHTYHLAFVSLCLRDTRVLVCCVYDTRS